MDKDQRHEQPPGADLASPDPAKAGKAAAATPKAAPRQASHHGTPAAPGRQAEGDYQQLPADLDGMHNDSWNPAVQAAGSEELAADAAERAAAESGREADRLFTGSPGQEGPAPNIPSTLNMHRDATAARTGHDQMHRRQREQSGESPAVTGGDVDADWMSGQFVGDETPAGDNPTPGMSVVDEVGKAIGVEYQDTEELKGAEKIEERDRRRWELDPASSEDYAERNKDEE